LKHQYKYGRIKRHWNSVSKPQSENITGTPQTFQIRRRTMPTGTGTHDESERKHLHLHHSVPMTLHRTQHHTIAAAGAPKTPKETLQIRRETPLYEAVSPGSWWKGGAEG
jgi:hypothetical protein